MKRTSALTLLFGATLACTGGGGGPPTADLPTSPPAPPTNTGDAGPTDRFPDAGVGPGARDAGDEPLDAGTIRDGGVASRELVEVIIDETGVHGQGAEIVDIDRDGDLDVIAAFSLTDTVRIYLNGGDGRTFTTVGPVTENTIVAMHAVAADLDGDRDLDLAAVGLFDRTGGFSTPGEVTWFENPGDLNDPWPRHEITGLTFWAPLIVRAGDLDGDGRTDLVVSSIEIGGQGNGLFWFRNTGGGFDGPIAVEATLGYVSSALLHDVDGDMDIDIVASSYSGGELVWYENQQPDFVRHTIAAVPGPYAMHLGQMDADPELEAISTVVGAGGRVAWFDPPADPRDAWTEMLVSSGRGEGEVRLTSGDFDVDGRFDVAMTSFAQWEIVVFFGGADGGFEAVQAAGDYVGANWITSGDLDGDGRAELLTTTYDFPGGDRISSWRLE